jgi:hypothetical protein
VHSRTLMAACAPLVVHTLMAPRVPVASLPTADLRIELKHRRSREDDRITIKHRQERHRNLDGDFGAANTTPMKQDAHTPTSPGSGGGCMVLAPHLRRVVWPCKFWPHLLEKYDRSINPVEFL